MILLGGVVNPSVKNQKIFDSSLYTREPWALPRQFAKLEFGEGGVAMKEIIAASILWAISLLMFIMSIRSFQEKGFLLNNAYLYATKQQREEMDKKPYYRQSSVIFLLIGIIFLLNGFSALLGVGWFSYVVVAVIIITLVYAIASSIAIEKRKKQL